MAREVISRDQKKDAEKNIEVEHTFINFQPLIIGEKLRNVEDFKNGKLKFNDLYYAHLMMKNDENLELFTKDSVNKVIDF